MSTILAHFLLQVSIWLNEWKSGGRGKKVERGWKSEGIEEILFFPCSVEMGVKLLSYGKLFYLVEDKIERMEEVTYENLLLL